MVSTNLNPGRKVLKVKPAVECIIMELCSAKGEDTPPSHISHTLPACATRGSRERGWQKSNGKYIQFLTTSYSLPYSCNPSPSQCIPNQSAGGAMLVKKPQPFECLLYLQTEACWNQRNYHMT